MRGDALGLRASLCSATAVLALGVLACKERKRVAPGARPTPLRVAFAGCESVRRGPVCELPEKGTLVLWFGASHGERFELTVDGRRWRPVRRDRVEGGVQLALRVPSGARELALAWPPAGIWRLRLSAPRPVMALERADALRQRGELQAAERVLRALPPDISPADRLRADGLLARLELARGHTDAAVAALERTRARALGLGLISRATDDALALSFLYTVNLRDFTRARRLLAASRRAASDYPEGLARVPYYEGVAAWESGDVRTALERARRAAREAAKLGLLRPRRHAQQQIALALATLGRSSEAVALQRQLLAGEAEEAACARADLHTNLAWIASLAAQSDPLGASVVTEPQAVDVAHHLQRAEALLEGCPDPFRRRNALINEALWAIARGDAASSRRALHRLAALRGGENTQHAIWEIDARARLALLEARAREAVRLFTRQQALAAASGDTEGEFRALHGLGRAHARLQARDAAVQSYLRAEQVLSRWLEWVPFGEGRDAFLGDRDDNARHLVEAQLELGDEAAAAASARRARARLMRASTRRDRLAGLGAAARQRWERAIGRYQRLRQRLERQAREDWTLAQDELEGLQPRRERLIQAIRAALDQAFAALHGSATRSDAPLRAPEPGELMLVYFPGPRAWIGFALSADEVVVRPLGARVELEAGPRALGRQLLEPFREQIERTRRLSFLPYGVLQALDFHALGWNDGVLLEQAPVAYLADTPASRRDSGRDRRERGVLIVADPQEDLPHARGEARRVLRALSGRPVRLLSGHRATRHAVLAALRSADVFHYAGHAVFGGIEGIDSALLLHHGSRLSAGDVLALPHVPRLVVLSACESARSSAAPRGTGFGLAQAFVAAGAAAVFAPVRPVQDKAAELLAAAFYSARLEGGSEETASIARAAQLRLRDLTPRMDWASFRLLRP